MCQIQRFPWQVVATSLTQTANKARSLAKKETIGRACFLVLFYLENYFSKMYVQVFSIPDTLSQMQKVIKEFWFILFFFQFLFISAYNVWVMGHFSPITPAPFLTPPPAPSLTPPLLLDTQQKLFCPYL
jgi:hypothetical protein